VSRQLAAEPRELSWSARLVFTLTAVTAFVLGVVGFSQLPANSEYGTRPVDIVYHSLQLFVLDAAPLQTATDLPVTLEIARFAAPAVTVYLIFLAVQALFAERLMQVRIRLTRGHSILCGPQDTVQQLADQIGREFGGKAVIIGGATRRAPGRGFLYVIGDPRQRRILERAGFARARELIAVGPDTVLNAEVAIAAHAINRAKRTVVTCYAEAQKDELFEAVVGQEVGPGEVNRLDTFNRHDRTARALLEHLPPALPSDPRSAVLVIGYGDLGQVLVDHLVRFWSGGDVPSEPLPRMCVLDADAPVEAVSRRHAASSGRVSITARRYDPAWLTTIDDLLVPAADGTSSVPGRIYVCLDDDAVGIAVGDTAVRLLEEHESTIVVAVPHSGVLGYAVSADGRAEPASGLRPGRDPSGLPAARTIGAARLLLISVVRTVYSIAAMRTGMNERLAKTIHETYRAHVMRRGESVANNESMRPWEQLPEYLKDSNREQAWDIGRKLALIDLSAVPARGDNGRIALTDEQVERLAKVEHRRWMNERMAKGWRYGSARDNVRKLHPDLVDWAHLSEGSRERDRSAVRAIPAHLTDAGLQIIRTRH
jgi:voltage-gated potassium channel Kch